MTIEPFWVQVSEPALRQGDLKWRGRPLPPCAAGEEVRELNPAYARLPPTPAALCGR